MARKKKKEPTQKQIDAKKKSLAEDIRRADVSEIGHKLEDCINEDTGRCEEARFAVFLGAGASFQSGIKTAGEMMKEFRAKILARNCREIKDEDKQQEWLDKNVYNADEGNDYSKLFEKFERTPTGRHNYISKIVKDKEPSFGYAMLASLLARGFVETILTTNFDDLMFIACNKFTGVRPVIYSYGIMATEMKFSMPHPKILKMHGDYLYSTLANTEREMKLFNQDPNMKVQVSNTLNEYELIIFGYSGSDNSVMKVLEDYTDGKELYWCHWSQELPSIRALELLKEKDGTLIAIEGFDDAMYEIHKEIGFEIDEVLAGYEERRTEILRFIDKFDKKYSTEVIEDAVKERKADKVKPRKEVKTWWENFAIAYDEQQKGNFKEAEKLYKKAIELNPNDATAYNNLGNVISEDKKRLAEAEDAYKKAIEINPNDATAYYNLGNLLDEVESRGKEAEEAYKKAIKINPNYATAYYNLGVLLAKDESRWKEAEEAFKKAIEINPNHASAYNNLGVLLFKDESRWKEAEEAYNKAIEINPNYADAYFNMACLRSLSELEENKDEAVEFLLKAVELDSEFKGKAKNDSDFDFIRDDERFKEIVGD